MDFVGWVSRQNLVQGNESWDVWRVPCLATAADDLPHCPTNVGWPFGCPSLQVAGWLEWNTSFYMIAKASSAFDSDCPFAHLCLGCCVLQGVSLHCFCRAASVDSSS